MSDLSILTHSLATRERSFASWVNLGSLPNPDPVLKALGQDIATYRDLLVSPEVGGAVRRRKAAVLAMERGLDRDRASSRLAKNVEAILADLPLDDLIASLLDAPQYGYAPHEIRYSRVGSLLIPTRIEAKPQEWFVFGPQNDLRFRSKTQTRDGEELPPRKFLLPRQEPTYQNPYGFPDLSRCFWPVTFLKGGLKFWVQFLEKYGSVWPIGKLPRSATDTDRNTLLQQLVDMVRDGVAVIPDDSSIEFLESAQKSASADLYESFLLFCRSQINIALLGQNQTTEKDSTYASAKTGLLVAHEIRDGDARIVMQTMKTLIRWLVDLNWGESVPAPVWSLWEQEEVDTVQAERDQRLYAAGARFTQQYFIRAYGLSEDEVTVEPAAAPGGESPPLPTAPAQFAEPDVLADQLAIDGALTQLAEGRELPEFATALLKPLFARVQDGASGEELLGALAELYPQMDTAGLTERLARMMLVAEAWGRLSVQAES